MLRIMKRMAVFLGLIAWTSLGSLAQAELISNIGNPSTYEPFFGYASTGQRFTATANKSIHTISVLPRLRSFDNATLHIYRTGGPGSVTGAIGNPDYTQTGIVLTAANNDDPLQNIELETPFPMEEGQQYDFYFSPAELPSFEVRLAAINDGSSYSGGEALANYGNENWPNFDLVFEILAKFTQTISFTTNPPQNISIGDTYAPEATASSNLPVGLSISAQSSSICSLLNGVVTFNAAGSCELLADQAGDDEYLPAAQASQSITVAAAPALLPQTISFTSTAPTAAQVGGFYTAQANASSGLAVSLSIHPDSSGICSLTAPDVIFAAAGTCTILANQAGDDEYLPAEQVQQSFLIAQSTTPPSTATPVPVLGSLGLLGLLGAVSAAGAAMTRKRKPS